MNITRVLGTTIAALGLAGSAVVLTPSVVSAHHPVITGETECTDDGWQIDATAQADADRSKEWRVSWNNGPDTAWQADEIPFTTTYELGLDVTSFEVKVTADWRPNGPSNETRTRTFTQPDDGCDEDVTPTTPIVTYDCVEDSIVITGADDTEAVVYTVTVDDPAEGEGDTWSVTITAAPEPGYSFPPGTQTEWPFSGIVDCDEEVTPIEPTVNYDCVEETIVITGDDQTGVQYAYASTDPAEGEGDSWNLTITATPAPGYEFPGGQTEIVWSFSGVVDCLGETTPVEPGVECVAGSLAVVDAVDTDQYTYSITGLDTGAEGDDYSIVVTAIAADGFEFPAEAQTEWTFEGTVDCVPNDIELTLLEPVCVDDVPYVRYQIQPIGFSPDPNDVSVSVAGFGTQTGGAPYDVALGAGLVPTALSGLSGQFLYPGAAESNGVGTDWPGWREDPAGSGNWVIDPSDQYLRDGVLLQFTINPTTEQVVAYPEATPDCANPPITPPAPNLTCIDGVFRLLGVENTDRYTYTVSGDDFVEDEVYDVTVTVAPGAAYRFAEGARTSWTFAGTVNCITEAVNPPSPPAQPQPPVPQIPETGSEAGNLLRLGAVIGMLGVVLYAVSRRRSTSTV